MQYALLNGSRVEAFSGGKGLCPSCGSQMIAKCGPRILHHWAHRGRKNCDPWWENETEWHRAWKNLYPPDCREVSHIAIDGEIHRADVKTNSGIIIEFQHSTMTDTERMSREAFYRNLVWVIDGRGFRDNFDIHHMLPDPKSELAADIVWFKSSRHSHGANRGMFFRISEALKYDPTITKSNILSGQMRELHSIHEIKTEIENSYNGFHQYDWIRPRKTWLDSNCPVFIDFGDDYIVKLCVYDLTGLTCIRMISKRKFVHDSMNENKVEDIASRYFPI